MKRLIVLLGFTILSLPIVVYADDILAYDINAVYDVGKGTKLDACITIRHNDADNILLLQLTKYATIDSIIARVQ